MELNNFKEKVTDQKDFVKRQTFQKSNPCSDDNFDEKSNHNNYEVLEV